MQLSIAGGPSAYLYRGGTALPRTVKRHEMASGGSHVASLPVGPNALSDVHTRAWSHRAKVRGRAGASGRVQNVPVVCRSGAGIAGICRLAAGECSPHVALGAKGDMIHSHRNLGWPAASPYREGDVANNSWPIKEF